MYDTTLLVEQLPNTREAPVPQQKLKMSAILIDSKGTAWPQEIEDDYARVRPLGQGAFGVVWLAKVKQRRETAITASDDESVDPSEREDTFDAAPASKNGGREPPCPYVAIKQISTEKEEERKYAQREIAILSEINHPNVARCLRSVEMPRSRGRSLRSCRALFGQKGGCDRKGRTGGGD